ncbi:MAG TPA: hypothetical protein DD454_00225 [Candidatus Moranbacteria bacterium]|nr:hypothetical protein [Candidatus Moranbacteria bacterium]
MQVVILAAGRGVRMGKITENTPKPMLPIKGKPILAHKIEALPREIDEVILIVGYLKEQIEAHFGNSYDGRRITYIEQRELDGTGGAINLAKGILKGKFLVMMGDDLYAKKDIESVMRHDLAVLGLEVMDPERFGVIRTGEDGTVVDIVEKPKIAGPALANIGLYVLNESFFDYPSVPIGNGEYGLPQTMVQMKDKNKIYTEKASAWFPIGNPDDYEKAGKIIDKFI